MCMLADSLAFVSHDIFTWVPYRHLAECYAGEYAEDKESAAGIQKLVFSICTMQN